MGTDRDLTVHDFEAFFREATATGSRPGVAPFPWQKRLVDEVARTGRWPDLLDLPTGAGKTSAIDVAIFLLALRPDLPRRVVFVVDRRVIVQQAAERARTLADRLRRAEDGVLAAVAERLRRLSAEPRPDEPVVVAELRGGIARDEAWAGRPDVPTVVVSTVDQVGSRLLFRGYGVSRGMQPVHAGLLGNDVLFLLDEVHLATPFSDTLHAIRARYRTGFDGRLPDRWQVVHLSATPNPAFEPERRFGLDDADRASPLGRRLAAHKPVEVRRVTVTGRSPDDERDALAAEAARAATELVTDGGESVVGVVMNRVDRAVETYRRLVDGVACEVVLLTGRMRPLDRDAVLASVGPRVRTGRTRTECTDKLIVVGTQTLEAGADFDFDAIVTEAASLDALRQRFGRVDRLGELSEHAASCTSVILASTRAQREDDPVYGSALRRTLDWLERHGVDDFGIDHLPTPDATEADAVVPPACRAPVLLPGHLDRWVQTSPRPVVEPDVAQWLHGVDASDVDVDVNVVWRCDLTEDLLRDARERPEVRDEVVDLVSAVPPVMLEAMPVPLSRVRSWLRGQRSASFADVDGSTITDDRASEEARLALRWAGDDERTTVISPDALSPGDTIVVPSDYGGITAGTWDPTSSEPVDDLAHVAALRRGRRVVLRMAASLLSDVADVPDIPTPERVDEEGLDDVEVVRGWVEALDPAVLASPLSEIATLLQASDGLEVQRVRTGFGLVYVVAAPGRQDGDQVVEADSEPETSSFTGVAVGLREHLADVEEWARRMADACGLPDQLREDVALAARLHDIGKCDPRFQAMLRGGALPDGELLAKSALPGTDRRRRRRARQAAGYPAGERHEMLSVALATSHPAVLRDAHDEDLVLHLVASHHGYGRPFAPVAAPSRPQEARISLDGVDLVGSTAHGMAAIDSGVTSRFWRVVRRYGWFGLAWLEAILRLADHRASERPGDRRMTSMEAVGVGS